MSREGTAGPSRRDLGTSARGASGGQGLGGAAGGGSKSIREPAGEGRGSPAPPLTTHLPETGEPPLGGQAALYIPSSPTHDADYGGQPAPAPLHKREDVEEPAGLAAVAEIAALECAIAEKERRLKAQQKGGVGGSGNGNGNGNSGAKGGAAAPAAAGLLPAKRKSEDMLALGQPLEGGGGMPPLSAALPMACGPPAVHPHPVAMHALGQPAGALPLGPAALQAVVGVPVQQAEALRAQQLQLQATILAQAQGHGEEVATSMGEIGASSCFRGDDDVDGCGESGTGEGGMKKQRLVWTTELHNRFINAITHLGLKHAVPKNILTMMNVEGMTRENVASHLQKYRMYLKKIGGYSDKDKVDPDALQAIHEQNVQQMAAQQALQHSLAAMHGGYGYAYGAVADSPTAAAAAGAAAGGGMAAPSQPAAAAAAAATAAVGQPVTGAPVAPTGYPMFQPPPGGPWQQFAPGYPGSTGGAGYPAQPYGYGMPYPQQPQPGASTAPAGQWPPPPPPPPPQQQQQQAQQPHAYPAAAAGGQQQQQSGGAAGGTGRPSTDFNNYSGELSAQLYAAPGAAPAAQPYGQPFAAAAAAGPGQQQPQHTVGGGSDGNNGGKGLCHTASAPEFLAGSA